jgi:RNA polymerase subunit RPABC4/transcription elongation factor Spt4
VSQKTLEEKALQVGDMMKCPHCAELIRTEANVCRYCGRELTSPDFVKQAAVLAGEGRKSEARQMLLYAIQRDSRNEEAWVQVSRIARGEKECEHSLRAVLAINPENAQARQQLEDLEQRRAARDKAAKRGALILVAVVVAIVVALGLAWAVLAVWTQLTG